MLGPLHEVILEKPTFYMYYDFQVHASKSSSKNIIQNGKTNISRTMEVTFLSGIWLIILNIELFSTE